MNHPTIVKLLNIVIAISVVGMLIVVGWQYWKTTRASLYEDEVYVSQDGLGQEKIDGATIDSAPIHSEVDCDTLDLALIPGSSWTYQMQQGETKNILNLQFEGFKGTKAKFEVSMGAAANSSAEVLAEMPCYADGLYMPLQTLSSLQITPTPSANKEVTTAPQSPVGLQSMLGEFNPLAGQKGLLLFPKEPANVGLTITEPVEILGTQIVITYRPQKVMTKNLKGLSYQSFPYNIQITNPLAKIDVSALALPKELMGLISGQSGDATLDMGQVVYGSDIGLAQLEVVNPLSQDLLLMLTLTNFIQPPVSQR